MPQAVRKMLLDVLEARLPCGDRPAPSRAPFVTLSFAQSLDGSIASRPGTTLRLSNSHCRTLTHGLRAATTPSWLESTPCWPTIHC